MEPLELRIEAPIPGAPADRTEESRTHAIDASWVEPDEGGFDRPRWILLLGAESDMDE